jgi:hypothetical protein
MRTLLLKKLAVGLFPILLWVWSPTAIMQCKMAMRECRCCPETVQAAGVSLPSCCTLHEKSSLAAVEPAKNVKGLFSDKKELPSALDAPWPLHQPTAIMVAALRVPGIPPSLPSLILLKQSLLI